MRGALVLLSLLSLLGCAREVQLDVDARAAGGDATLQVTVYADEVPVGVGDNGDDGDGDDDDDDGDDGAGASGGCAPWRFSERPALTALSVAVLDDGATALELPRLGDKLVVVDAVVAGSAVARGCAAVGDVDGVVAVTVALTTTHRISSDGGDVVLEDDDDALAVRVVGVDGAPAAGAAVSAVAEDAVGAVVDAAVLVADAAGGVSFAPRATLPGPLRLTLVPENPAAVDVAVVADAFVTPRVQPLFADDAAYADPSVVGLGGSAVGVVDHVVGADDAGAPHESLLLDAFGAVTTLGPPAGALRFLGAFAAGGDDDDGDRVFFAVSDAFAGGAVRAVDEDGAVIDEVSVGFDLLGGSGAVAVSVASCRGGGARPLLLVSDDGAAFIDVAFGSIVAVPADAAFAGAPPALSGCVNDAGGARHRVVFSSSSVGGGPRDLGDGVARITDADDVSVTVLTVDDRVIHYAVRDDGTALAARVDGAEVLVVPRVVDGGALAVAPEGAVRLPSAPVFLAQGGFFGDAGAAGRDVVAVLDLATAADPSANALFGAVPIAGGGAVDGGVDLAVCRPLSLCPRSRTVDVDGDGRPDLVTFRERGDGRVSVVAVLFGVR